MNLFTVKLFRRVEVWMLLVVLLATFLRVYRLQDFPPALYWDEAFDGFDALRILQTPSHPLFFEGNTGREPLTIYLQALGMMLWGAHDWAIRIVPAWLGIVTIPLMYRLAVTLFSNQARAKEIGLLAAGMLAIAFWHIDLSRLALRAIAFPLLSAVMLYLFWRGWQNGRMVYFALAGIALGLTLYTYLASRLLPIVFIGFIFVEGVLIATRRSRLPSFDLRRSVLGLAVMFIVTAIVFLPVGIYFWQNPGAFFLRASYISIFSGDARGLASLPSTVLTTIRMFIDHGDTEIIRNLPGLPVLDPIAAFGFWIGLVIALVRFSSHPAYLLLLLWFGVNLLPTFFSVDIPNFMRTSDALLVVCIIAADGWSWLRQRFIPRLAPLAWAAVVVAFGGIWTFNNYFSIWGPASFTYDYFNGARRTIVERAISLSRQADVAIPLDLYATANAQFYLAPYFSAAQPLQESDRVNPSVWIVTQPAERNFVILQNSGRVLVPQPLDDKGLSTVAELFKSGQTINDPFKRSVAREFQANDASALVRPLNPTHPLNVTFGKQIKLLGFDLTPAQVSPGSKVHVTYYWQALVDVESDYWVVSTLLDPAGNAFGKRISEPVDAKGPTSLWRRGVTILDSFDITIPATAHDGKYRFEIALINPISPDQSLPVSATEDRLLLDPFTVTKTSGNPSSPEYPLLLRLGDPSTLTLLGYDLEKKTIQAGDVIRIALYWKTERAPTVDYSVFLHLLDAAGNIIAQQDGPPQNGDAPTSWWRVGDTIVDEHEIVVPSQAQAGAYTLALGVYDPLNGPRLQFFDAANKLGDSFELPIQVVNH